MIINTFISDSEFVPSYTAISLKRARDLNPNTPIYFICKKDQSYFKKLNISWIDQSKLANHDLVKRFNELSWFNRHGTPNTTYPSPEGFWHRTCERIFYLAAYCDLHKTENVLHIENDVIMYYSYDYFMSQTSNSFCATAMSQKQATFAVMFIPLSSFITHLCEAMLKLMKYGERFILNEYKVDHVSEMTLLKICMDENIIDTFSILPERDYPLCFDPGSYGQFLGGTNNGHGPGFKDPNHYPWMLQCEAYINDGVPYVSKDGLVRPLFNLHVHSKKLENFI
jgi:hypothetical protein